MGVFFVLLLFPIMIQHFTIGNNKVSFEKKNRNALLFFFCFFTILVMFRHAKIGNDTRNYIYYFNMFAKMDWENIGKESIELGFAYFNKFVSLFSKEPQFFFSVTAIVSCCMIYPTYKRLCVDPSLTIVLFCTMSTFVMMFSGIRQMIAVAIGFIAYEATRKKNLISFILAVFLAITFHTSAFMLIFMYPIYHAKITKKWLCMIVPLLAVIFVFNKQVFLVLGSILERYTKYSADIKQTGAYTMLVLFGIFVVFSFLIPEEAVLDEELIGMRNFMLFSFALQMFAPLHAIAMRMNYYYIIFIPLLLPKIIQYRNNRWSQVAVIGRHVMLIFFLVYFFYSASTKTNNLNVFPYYFFWETIG